MNATDLENLQSLIRKAVSHSIMEGKDTLVIYEDKGNGSAIIVEADSLPSLLSLNPEKVFTLLCTVRANGDVEPSSGDLILKYKRI